MFNTIVFLSFCCVTFLVARVTGIAVAPSGNLPLLYDDEENGCMMYDPVSKIQKAVSCGGLPSDYLSRSMYCIWKRFDEKGNRLASIMVPNRWCNGAGMVNAYVLIDDNICQELFVPTDRLKKADSYFDDKEDCKAKRRTEKKTFTLPLLWKCNGNDCPNGRCVIYDRASNTTVKDVNCRNNKQSYIKQKEGNHSCVRYTYFKYKFDRSKAVADHWCEVKQREKAYDIEKRCGVFWFNSGTGQSPYNKHVYKYKDECLDKLLDRCGPNAHTNSCTTCGEPTCEDILKKRQFRCAKMCTGAGCVCDRGYARNRRGACIPEAECKAR